MSIQTNLLHVSNWVCPGKNDITKGQHWHNSKWEQFIVVHGLIEERNINTGEKVSSKYGNKEDNFTAFEWGRRKAVPHSNAPYSREMGYYNRD